MAIGLGFVVAMPASAGTGQEALDDQAATGSLESSPDTANYAKYWAVSIDEAAADLRMQAEAGLLDEELTKVGDKWFGGLWIEHNPGFQVVAASTDPANPDLAAVISSSGLADVVKVKAATRTLSRLLADAEHYASVSDGTYRVHVDVPRNRVVLGAHDPTAALSRLSSQSVELTGDDTVQRDDTQVTLTSPVQGGRNLNGVESCTSGFNVVEKAGLLQRYASTAAHCSNSMTYEPTGHALTFVAQKYTGSYDVQIHAVPVGDNLPNVVYDGVWPLTKWRPINSRTTRAQQVVGGTYCKRGRTTGYDCGELQSKNEACDLTPQVFTCMWLSRSGVDMAGPGDSGGPVFDGFSAVGWIHACVSNDPTGQCGPFFNDAAIYMAEDYVETAFAQPVQVLIVP